MQKFFILEGGYLLIGLFILGVTLFVSTRPFMPRGSYKKGLSIVGFVLAILIGAHFYVTTSRMAEVRNAFEQDKPILQDSEQNGTNDCSQNIPSTPKETCSSNHDGCNHCQLIAHSSYRLRRVKPC